MSPDSPKEILDSYGILPAKSFGQNFLINKGILDKIIQSADIEPDDTIIEIGPGLGILTIELAKKSKQVIAIEKDKKMIEILKEKLKDYNNIEIVNEDALKISNFKLIKNFKFQISNYKVVANLPYNVATAIIRMFLENPPTGKQPKSMVLMVQKEVAQRICSNPPNMSILSISVQLYGNPKIISNVSAGSFWPMPKVDSAILKIIPRIDTDAKQINTDLFFKIVRAGFSQPRKQIIGNLNKILELNKPEIQNWLAENNINPSQRAETLSIKNWLNLTRTLPVVF